jgi:hypothetical protein
MVARIIGGTLSLYGFVDNLVVVYFTILRPLWESILWLLIVPLLLASVSLLIARRKFVSAPTPK